MMGININDKEFPFTEAILSGKKVIETRYGRSLDPYIGQKVGLVRTGKGKATLVGYAVIGKPKVYKTRKQFDSDWNKHLVASDSKFSWKGIKYGYPLMDIESTRPRVVTTRGIVARKI